MLTVSGSYSQGAGAALEIDLTGPAAGGFDQLAVGGSVSIAGTVAIAERAGFVTGPEFRFLTAGGTAAVSGTFAGSPDGTELTFGGKPYRLRYAVGDGNDVAIVFDGPKLSVGSVRQAEGNAGRTRFEFPVTMSRAWDVPVTVRWATEDDTAVAGEDYIAASGTLTFLPGGPLTQTAVVEVYGDLDRERTERFRVVLADAVEAAIATGTGVGTIANDDGVLNLPDNQGTEFWLTFPGNYYQEFEPQTVSLFLTGDQDTTGVVSVPGLGFSQPFTVVANQVTTVVLPISTDLNEVEAIRDRGVHVTADDEIAVYGLNRMQYTTDAFLGLPVDVLGTEYVVLGWKNGPFFNGSQMAVVATEDGTQVTITPSGTAGTHPAGVPFTITLNAGQTYLLRSGSGFDLDLSGTRIVSSAPVAVFGGHQCANIPTDRGYCDYVVEQLPPVETWGRAFVTVPLATRSGGDTFRLVAAEDGTVVTIDGVVRATLDAGQVFDWIQDGPAEIAANRPVLVAQYSNGATYDGTVSDPFMMLVPPYEQFQSAYTVTTPEGLADSVGFDTNFLNVVVPTAAVGTVTLDGVAIPAGQFTPIGTSGFSGAQVPVTRGSHHLEGAVPFGLFVYGYATDDSYGYTGGLALAPVASAAAIGVTPAAATLAVGGTHRVTASVTDAAGKRLAGIRVDFTVAGANAATGFALTDANGQATFAYTGSARGGDTITAAIGTLTAAAAADWVLAAPTIAVDGPPNGSSFPAGATVLVTGLATAGNPAAPIAAVTADGVPVAVDAAGRFFARVPLGPGTKTVRFVATDVYGQTAETTHTLVGTQAPAGRVDFAALVEVGHVRAEYGRTSFDEDTHTLFADVTVRNAGTYAIGGPVLVGVRNLSDLSVSVPAPDGYAPDGTPYFDLTARGLVAGDLAPGAAATAFALAFVNPNRVRFTYDLVLLGVPNRAPTFTSVPALDATTGRPYAYSATAADPDGHPVAYSLAAGPVGMNVDPATGVLAWTPAAGDVGTHAVAVRATDGRGGSAVQSFTITVSEPAENRPPVFASVPPVGGSVNVLFGYAPIVTDADGDALTYTVVGPAGVTIDPATGVLVWTPAAGQVGDHAVTVTASDGRGGVATQTFTVRVTPEPGNTAPVFVSPTTATTLAGQPFAYAARAVDADGDPLAYALVGTVPAGLTMTADGLVSWTPAAVGSFAFTVRATDGRGGVADQIVTVAVGSDAPVTLTGTAFADADADGVFDPGEAALATWAVYVDGNANGRRDPGEPSATVAADGTYAISGLPAGTHAVAIERADGWVFTVPADGRRVVTTGAGETVTGLDFGAVRRLTPAVNRDPVLTATVPASVIAGQTFGFVPAAADADGDPLTFDLPVGPRGMAVDQFTGRVVWVPTADQVGPAEGLLRVRDGRGGVALLPFAVTVVGANTPPAITSAPTGPAVAGRPYEYRVAAQDADGDPLAYSLTGTPPAGMGIDPAAGVLTWTPTAAQAGDHPVTIAVSDGRGGSVTQSFTLRVVVPVANAAPAVTSTPVGPATVGSPYRYAVTATDPDGDPVSFALTTAPAGMAIDAGTGVLTWTPGVGQIGDHAVVIEVSDGRGGVTTQSFTLPVVRANAAPAITSTPVGPARAGTPYRYAVTAIDPDGDPVSFALTTAPVGMSIDPASGVLSWTPTAGQIGDHSVTIEVSDGRGGVRTQSFTLPAVADTPETPNAPPTITSTPVGPARAGTPYRYAVTATDPDGDPVSFALTTAPVGMSIDPASGVLSWTPTAGQIGDHSVTIEVSDGRGGVRTQSFTLPAVADTPETPNAPPTITSTPGGPAMVGSPYRYAVAATDAEGDVLNFALGAAPVGMSIDATTGVVAWTPAVGQVGSFPIEILVSDGRDTVTQTFTLPAIAADRPPAFASTPHGPAEVGIPYRYPARAVDPDGDPVTYTLVGAPAGMAIDPANGVLTWTPDAAGTAAFTVRATARGVSVDQAVDLVVQASGGPNQAPTLGGSPTGPAVAGRPWTYAPIATDPDGDTVRFALPVGPAGMTVDPATGVLNWTPTAGQVGSHSVTLRAIDARGAAVEQSFVLTAVAEPAPNRSPSVTAHPARTATVGAAYQTRIAATDPDGDPLTFTTVTLPAGMSLSSGGVLTWTPTAAQVGDHPVTVRVIDGRGGEVSVAFMIAVSAVAAGNAAPTIVSTPGLDATVGTAYAYDARAVDPDGDAVAWSLDTAPVGASIDAARGTLRWTPGAAGLAEFVVRATDARGATTTQRFGIAVAGLNSAPLISSTPVTRATVGQAYAYAVRAVDADGDPVTFTLTTAPAGMTVDPATGLIRWTPAAALVGTTVDVTVVAADHRGGSQPQSFRIVRAIQQLYLHHFFFLKM